MCLHLAEPGESFLLYEDLLISFLKTNYFL